MPRGVYYLKRHKLGAPLNSASSYFTWCVCIMHGARVPEKLINTVESCRRSPCAGRITHEETRARVEITSTQSVFLEGLSLRRNALGVLVTRALARRRASCNSAKDLRSFFKTSQRHLYHKQWRVPRVSSSLIGNTRRPLLKACERNSPSYFLTLRMMVKLKLCPFMIIAIFIISSPSYRMNYL